MLSKVAKAFLLLSVAALAGWAETLSFSCISGTPAGTREPACSLGEAQLAVDVIGVGATTNGSPYESFTFDQGAVTPLMSQALFRFYLNDGEPLGNIHEVYFDGPGPLLALTNLYSVGQVLYTSTSVSPPNLPDARNVSPTFNATPGFWADTVRSSRNGVNDDDESLGLLFNLQSGKTFADLLSALDGGGLRIGVHAGGFPKDQSASFVNKPPNAPIPEPGLFVLAGAGLGLIALRRRW